MHQAGCFGFDEMELLFKLFTKGSEDFPPSGKEVTKRVFLFFLSQLSEGSFVNGSHEELMVPRFLPMELDQAVKGLQMGVDGDGCTFDFCSVDDTSFKGSGAGCGGG